MINRLRDSRSFYILLSILLAVLVWLYIRDVENPTQDGTYYGIEIQVSGERVLEERGLTVASISQKTVNITVNAPISVHNDLSRENITATVDVSQCSEPGEYQLACTPKLPSNIDTTGAFFPDSAQIVTVVIDNLSTETKTLELKLEGSVADGYQAGTPVFDPETVELSGTAEQLAQVSRAVVILEADGLKQSYSGRLPITLLDENDEPLTDTNISLSEETAYLTLPVGVMKEVPLTVSFIPGGGATGDGDVEVDIQPKTISVIGTVDDNLPGELMRDKVGIYAEAGYPAYKDENGDGYPDDVNVSKRLAVFIGNYPDYYETYRPKMDGPFVPSVKDEKGHYIANAAYKDVPGAQLRIGNLPRTESTGVHSIDDLVVGARGPHADAFRGFMNSTEVFRIMSEALALGNK